METLHTESSQLAIRLEEMQRENEKARYYVEQGLDLNRSKLENLEDVLADPRVASCFLSTQIMGMQIDVGSWLRNT